MGRGLNSTVRVRALLGVSLLFLASTLQAQEGDGSGPEKVKPVTLRIGVPNKQSDRDVVFPLIVETFGAAAVGRIRAEFEMSGRQGWSFRGIDLTRGLDVRNRVRKNSDGADKLVVEWDISAEGKELPTGHLALFRVQAGKAVIGGAPASDSPPTLVLRKMSWGLAEFERQQETLPQLETPDNLTGNPDVSCFFFTH